ncbi:unnamed protein product, partial [marine sediment metagenome]
MLAPWERDDNEEPGRLLQQKADRVASMILTSTYSD